MEGPWPKGIDGTGSLMCVEVGFRIQIKGVLLLMVQEFHCLPSSPHTLCDMEYSAQSSKKKKKGNEEQASATISQ